MSVGLKMEPPLYLKKNFVFKELLTKKKEHPWSCHRMTGAKERPTTARLSNQLAGTRPAQAGAVGNSSGQRVSTESRPSSLTKSSPTTVKPHREFSIAWGLGGHEVGAGVSRLC